MSAYRTIVAVLILVTAGLAGVVVMRPSEKPAEKYPTELNRQLDQRFETSVAEKRWMPPIDVTDTVESFIHPGMSFDDAEAVLHASGFSISKHPDPSHYIDPTRPDRDAVYARRKITGRGEIMVPYFTIILFPRMPGDYRTVGKVFASFHIPTL